MRSLYKNKRINNLNNRRDMRIRGNKQIRVVSASLINTIISAVMNYYDITEELICSESRKKEYTEPRHIACALVYSFTHNSQEMVGARFGGKNHATINHSMKNVVNWYETDKGFKDMVDKIIAFINFECKHSFTFQQVIDVKNGVKGVKYKRDTLVESFNTKIEDLMYTEDETAILDIVRKLKEINGEIWSRGIQKEFKEQLKREADAKQTQEV